MPPTCHRCRSTAPCAHRHTLGASHAPRPQQTPVLLPVAKLHSPASQSTAQVPHGLITKAVVARPLLWAHSCVEGAVTTLCLQQPCTGAVLAPAERQVCAITLASDRQRPTARHCKCSMAGPGSVSASISATRRLAATACLPTNTTKFRTTQSWCA